MQSRTTAEERAEKLETYEAAHKYYCTTYGDEDTESKWNANLILDHEDALKRIEAIKKELDHHIQCYRTAASEAQTDGLFEYLMDD